MENLPVYIILCFSCIAALTLFFFYKATDNSKIVLIVSLVWLAIQAALGLSKFYTVTNTLPPRFAITILPPLVLIITMFITERGKAFIDKINLQWITLLHVIRIPVELMLIWLFVHNYIPQLMTFEGRNFDVLSGITAPLVFYLGYVKKNLGKNILLAWNFICLGLLLNIVVNAILSAPFPFQKFAFDQPNRALLYFPFVWLPSFIVPVVLLSHVAAIRRLVKSREQAKESTLLKTASGSFQ